MLVLTLLVAACLLVLMWLSLTEFSYVGAAATRRVYDLNARTYNRKWLRRSYRRVGLTKTLFVTPMRAAVSGSPGARVLDLACGTGRMSLLLLDDGFQGTIDAVDASEPMLASFRRSLADAGPGVADRVSLQQSDICHWQSDEANAYAVVTLMEASELLMDLPGVIQEVATALKPGGLFMFTVVPWPLRLAFPGRYQSPRLMRQLLRRNGFDRTQIKLWRVRYSVVYAWKADAGGNSGRSHSHLRR